MPTQQTSLPINYDRPPLVESVLGVQFDRLPGFTNAHLGAFWKTLDTQYWSVVQDTTPIPSQFERFDREAHWAKAFQLQITQDPTCRLQIKNKDGDGMIQLQNNRLHFNWLGESGGSYPRYEKVLDGFISVLKQFLSFVTKEEIGAFRANQWEVTYVNHIPKESVWNAPSDWCFFKPLSCLTFSPYLQNESFNGEWQFVIPDQKGRLYVQWHHGLKSPVENKEGEEIVRLMFTARGPIEGENDKEESIVEGLNLGRRTIVLSFKELMTVAANEYWGLKNATDKT